MIALQALREDIGQHLELSAFSFETESEIQFAWAESEAHLIAGLEALFPGAAAAAKVLLANG